MKIRNFKGFKKELNSNKFKRGLTGDQLSKVRGGSGNNYYEDDEEYKEVYDEVKNH